MKEKKWLIRARNSLMIFLKQQVWFCSRIRIGINYTLSLKNQKFINMYSKLFTQMTEAE